MKKNLFKKFLESIGVSAEIPFQEKMNLAEWLESRLHLSLTNMADDMFGQGNVTRDERKVLSGAIGVALDGYHQHLTENAPQLFERRPWDEAPSDAAGQQVSEAAEFVESGAQSMCVPLIEKAVRGDGTIPVKIIQPGWGSSGYYPAEVLERDGPKVFKKGTKMYWNHQTPREEAERPEGDLRNLAAELMTDARYMANGKAGAGLYADAKVFESYKSAIDDLAPHIGTSIRATGKAQQGMAEGREGAIVTELSRGRSIDFVTVPGAGGQIVSLFEAARGAVQNTTTESVGTNFVKESNSMDEKEFKALQESVATLQTTVSKTTDENARLKEALALRDAKDAVTAALASQSLPEATKARLIESLPMAAPMKDGALDVEAFKAKIAEVVTAEVEYLTKTLGLGTIKGLGESASDDGGEADVKFEETLEGAFSDLGLSEAAAKKAAQGRK